MIAQRFTRIPSPDAPLPVRQEWLVALSLWLYLGPSLHPNQNFIREDMRTIRLREFLTYMNANPASKEQVALLMRSVIKDSSGFSLFSATGLPSESGFFSDFVDRLSKWLIPRPPNHTNLAEFFIRLFQGPEDARWLSSLPNDVIQGLAQLMAHGQPPGQSIWQHLSLSVGDALLYLGCSVGYFGMDEEVRNRTETSCFLLLGRKIAEAVSAQREQRVISYRQELFAECMEVLSLCRQALTHILHRLEHSGVSVHLVYKLEKLGAHLDRIALLLEAITQPQSDPYGSSTPQVRADLVRRLAVTLAQGCFEDLSIRALVHTNLKLLSRKIVERTGEVGEHYITRTRAQYFTVLWQAGGGGVLTLGTTMVKFWTTAAKFPYFFEFLFCSVNYAGSFVIMHFAGFKLATKQPAMFASALAGKLRNSRSEFERKAFVDEVARVVRSQMAALMGNLGFVIPATLLGDRLFLLATGHHFLDAKQAHYVLHSLHPWESVTIPAAALTGVLLYMASVSSGWLENWLVYRRVPEGIATSRRFHLVFGRRFSRKLGLVVQRHAGGVGGSIALGVLLAATPIIGKIFGLPIDIRHVTLSTSSLTFAVTNLGKEALHMPQVYFAVGGIVLIGALNFGVSFIIALITALRARDVSARHARKLASAVGTHLKQKPLDFIWPPRGS